MSLSHSPVYLSPLTEKIVCRSPHLLDEISFCFVFGGSLLGSLKHAMTQVCIVTACTIGQNMLDSERDLLEHLLHRRWWIFSLLIPPGQFYQVNVPQNELYFTLNGIS